MSNVQVTLVYAPRVVAFVVFAVVYVLGVVFAAVRVVRAEVRRRHAKAALERDILARTWRVTIAGAAPEVVIGHGSLVQGMITAVAVPFVLRKDDGASIMVAEGALVTMKGAGRVRDGIVTAPADTLLLLVPPDEACGTAPYRAPPAAFVRGDGLVLLDLDALELGGRVRLSWLRFAGVFGVMSAVLVLAVREAPDSAWNTGLFLLAMLLGIDQLTARGTITRGLCMAEFVGRRGRRAP